MIIENEIPSGEQIKILSSGPAFFAQLENLIDKATEEIHLQVYIFKPDATGLKIANAIYRAALRGVKTYLLIDAFGSSEFPVDLQQQLENAGVQIKRYGPLLSGGKFHIGRRLHRKVMVFDRKIAIVAGLNISDNYNGETGRKAWLDFAVILEGNIVAKLYSICLQRWIKKPLRTLPLKRILTAGKTFNSIVRVRQNDMLRGLNEANASCREEIRSATRSLFIVGGYFLPGGRVRRLLKSAVQRGVRVQIIIAEESDVAIQRNAVQYLYRWMLEAGIEIYEYLPSNVHGKVLIADRQTVQVGSYDMNNLSTYSNIELNLDIPNEKIASGFQDWLERIAITDCRRVTIEEMDRRANPWRQFKYWFSYQLVKSLFVLATWLAHKDEEEYQ